MEYPMADDLAEFEAAARDIGLQYQDAEVDVLKSIDRDIEEGPYSWAVVELGEFSEGVLLKFEVASSEEVAMDVGELGLVFALHDEWTVPDIVGKKVPVITGESISPQLAVEGAESENLLVLVYNEWKHDVGAVQII